MFLSQKVHFLIKYHDMQYKKQVEDSEAIMRELKECADVIHQTDEKMMRLRERIHRIDPE